MDFLEADNLRPRDRCNGQSTALALSLSVQTSRFETRKMSLQETLSDFGFGAMRDD